MHLTVGEVGGERCPVALFKQFVSRQPQNLKMTGPFYLSIKTNRRPDDIYVWFKVQPMGENKQLKNFCKTGMDIFWKNALVSQSVKSLAVNFLG